MKFRHVLFVLAIIVFIIFVLYAFETGYIYGENKIIRNQTFYTQIFSNDAEQDLVVGWESGDFLTVCTRMGIDNNQSFEEETDCKRYVFDGKIYQLLKLEDNGTSGM